MVERSRAATPSPWRRPGPTATGRVDIPPPVDAAVAHRPEEGTPEPDEPRRPRSRRRLIRWVAIVVAIVMAVLACWQDPLYAL